MHHFNGLRFSAAQRSAWLLTLNLVDACDAKLITANLDEPARLGVRPLNALPE